jgi:hypothetical protein
LDLGESRFIKDIKLFGVLDGPGLRFEYPKLSSVIHVQCSVGPEGQGLADDLVVLIGDGTADEGTLNPACGGSSKKWHAGQHSQAQKAETIVECNLQGRYVVIKKHPTANLGIVLCEVQVWEAGWF